MSRIHDRYGMKCLHCGYCCKNYCVVVVKDPEKGYDPDDTTGDNFLFVRGDGTPCPHLRGDRPGEYSCAVHDKPWYKLTPCFEFTQIERGDTPCRIGTAILAREKEKLVEGTVR